MTPSPSRPVPIPRQLDMLAATTRPNLNPHERREVVVLLAGLLMEAGGMALEVGDDRV